METKTKFNRTLHRKIWTFLANPALYTPHMQRTVLGDLVHRDTPNYMAATLYKAYAVKILSETDEGFRKKVEALELQDHMYCVGCATKVDKNILLCVDFCQVYSACTSYDCYGGMAWPFYSLMCTRLHNDIIFSPDDISSIAEAAYNIAFCDMDRPEEGYIDEMVEGGKVDETSNLRQNGQKTGKKY